MRAIKTGQSGYNKKIKQLLEVAGIDRKVAVFDEAAGLHRQVSKAVQRYTMLELKDRFALMCAEFEEERYKVDDRLEAISA